MRERAGERLEFLDGLRGLACLQVCLLHGFGLLMPGMLAAPSADDGFLGWVWRSAARLAVDGESAVFLFFVLSGFVLSAPFARHAGRPGAVMLARLARFVPPAFLACALGWAALRLCGDLHLRASDLLGDSWLGGNWTEPPTVGALLRDALGNVLLLGYGGLSILDALPDWMGAGLLWPDTAAFDPPLWTLSVELHGSALVLLLACARRRSRLLWALAVVVAGALLWRSPLLCFLAGHLAAAARDGRRPAASVRAAVALSVGVALCAAAPEAPFIASWLGRPAPWPSLPGLDPAMVARGWGAILIFYAALGLGRGVLDRKPLLWLGQLSFPIYLVHWTALSVAGSAVVVVAAPLLGLHWAGACGLLVAGLATVLCAYALRPVDEAAIQWSRRLRDGRPRANDAASIPGAVRAPS